MSDSTLTNLTHPADHAPVDVDVKIALDVVRRAWLAEGPEIAARMLRLEDGFLTVMHGEDYHLLPEAAAVLGVKPS